MDLVQLVYGPIEDTMLGPAYRHKLGELLVEREYQVSPATFAVALQADRSLAVTKGGRGVGNFPPALQPYIKQVLQEV